MTEKTYRVKERKSYPWPCEIDKDRTITLFPDDELIIRRNGLIAKTNGLFCLDIHVPTSDLVEIEPQEG